MNKARNILWGIAFIAVGLIIASNALGFTDINLFFDGWWAILFIVLPCTVGLFKNESRTGNIIGIIIGLFLFLCCQDILDFDMFAKLLVPMILVSIGISFIFKDVVGKNVSEKIKELTAEKSTNENEYCATFSGQKLDFSNQVFENSAFTAVFGGVDANLRNVIITEDKVITVCAIFGGVDIKVPENVNVKIRSTSIFGGIDSKRPTNIENVPTIYIDGTCLFGGASVK